MVNQEKVCSFCGRPSQSIVKLRLLDEIVPICTDCIDICSEITDSYRDLKADKQKSKAKKDENIVSFDELMDIALIFCLTKTELIDAILLLVKKYSDFVTFTDDGGIKQLFFLKEIDKTEILDTYYF